MNIKNHNNFQGRIRIKLNGNFFSCSDNMSINDLIEYLDFKSNKIILEYNCKVVSNEKFADTIIKDGDKIEIVTIVGGG
jgi:sulfur carrier protein